VPSRIVTVRAAAASNSDAVGGVVRQLGVHADPMR
jgi:hypothetical protein